MMRDCVYPGSFDPLTAGHLDIIKRSAALFDTVHVAVLNNPRKAYLFGAQARFDMALCAVREMGNVRVVSSEGLLTDLMRENDIRVIVRGVRTGMDLEVEQQMASANARLLEGAETLFLPARPEYAFLSSTLIKELLFYGADVSGYVPDAILKMVCKGDAK